MKDSLGDRMKNNYENRYRMKLTRKTPAIIRLDGKAFHTLTKKCDKPFDNEFIRIMSETSKSLCENIQGVKCAYVQSDEISFLLTDFDNLKTDAWFDYNIQKITSVSASMATAFFNYRWDYRNIKFGFFDSRVFNIPKSEVCNYFVWRQQDWIRNSIHMLARSLYSHEDLHGKNSIEMHDMIREQNVDWHDLTPEYLKYGTFIYKIDTGFEEKYDIIFKDNRELIEKYLFI